MAEAGVRPGLTLYTVGHSNRDGAAFVSILLAHGVGTLVDVRRFPRSKRHPQFSEGPLEASLRAAGILYRHEPDLGGWREPRADSLNTAWPKDALRGYADHMSTDAFRSALDRLLERAAAETTAVMCAEADPRQCHRQLLADALVAAGAEVVHIRGLVEVEAHALHPAARVQSDGRIHYPAPAAAQGRLFDGA